MAPNYNAVTSFPQLKYPSKRDVILKDATNWLEGKVLDDEAESLWRIHDKLYDLNEFINRHPGGRDWLELTKGTDITEAFECHHIGGGPEKLLPHFFIREAKMPRNSPFTFDENGFYRTLKVRIRKELDKVVSRSYEWRSEAITDGLLAFVLLSTPLACIVENIFILAVLVAVCSLALTYCVISSHNFFHKKDNWRMYIWNLSHSSYREWRVTHAMSHHLYPNTLLDIEITFVEPFMFFLAKPKPLYNIFVLLYAPFLYSLTFWMQSLRKIALCLTKDKYFKTHCFWHDMIPLALPLWMFLASGATAQRTLLMWSIIISIAGFIFTFIGLTAAHHHPDVFHDGDEPIGTTLDWGVHQMEAVMDCVETTGSLFKVLTSFGDHALHHLFPTIDHAVLPLLYPAFYEVCDQFSTTHKLSTSMELVLGKIRQMYRTSKRNREQTNRLATHSNGNNAKYNLN